MFYTYFVGVFVYHAYTIYEGVNSMRYIYQYKPHQEDRSLQHYYGDIVRFLFMCAAVVMIVGLPVVSNYLSLPTWSSVMGVLVLGLAAGFTNPVQVWDAVINVVVASVGFFVFDLYTVQSYQNIHLHSKFFIANMVLAAIFVFATYFSVKTLRGLLLQGKA